MNTFKPKTGRKLIDAPRKKKEWTPAEENYLQDKWGTVSINGLAKRLGRSKNAVIVRARRLGLGAHLDSDHRMPLNQLMVAVFGEYSTGYAKRRLIEAGLPVKKHRVNKCCFLVIYPEDFWKWAEENKSLVDFKNFEPYAIGPEPEWAKVKRKYDQNKAVRTKRNHNQPWTKEEDDRLSFLLKKGGFTYKDLQEDLHRTEAAIKRRIRDLNLKERPAKAKSRSWTEEEIECLLQMVEAGAGWIQISDRLDRSALAVRGKYERLQNPEYMKRYNRGQNKTYEYTGIRDITPDEIRQIRNLTRDIELSDAPPGRKKERRMRYTKNHCGVYVIPKDLLQEATKKLARLENTEENEDVGKLIRKLRKHKPTKKLMEEAADALTVINDFEDLQSLTLRKRMNEQRKELLDFLDDIDGQLIDDPVAAMREKVTEVFR